MSEPYALPIAEDAGVRRLLTGWLGLALFSLVAPGLLVILIVLARTPTINEWIPWVGSFKTALVIHVDLLVLVWFLAFAAILGVLNSTGRGLAVARLGLGLAVAGAAILALSPLLATGVPHMNNYVPVLENGPFFIGLILYLAGMSVTALHGVWSRRPFAGLHRGEGALQVGVVSGLAILLLSILFWLWSWRIIPSGVGGDHYYELLFWGGGHLLQFTHTQLVMVVWLWLASAAGAGLGVAPRLVAWLLVVGALPVLAGPVLQLWLPIDAIDYRNAFTDLMWYGGGLAAAPIGLLLVRQGMGAGASPERTCLLASLFLFALGGVIGFLIAGVNVTIPAHYHGSIVAITLAYMGLTYHLLPRLGGRPIPSRLASRQALLLVVGQSMHSLGLAWSGGHNVQRKVAGAEQLLQTTWEKIPMYFMSVGGMLAVAGGVLFLVLALRSIWPLLRYEKVTP